MSFRFIAVSILGLLLDWCFGDMFWLYHPVRLIGLWILVIVITCGGSWLVLTFCNSLHPLLGFGLEVFWCYRLLALHSLEKESMKVYDKLQQQDISAAPVVSNVNDCCYLFYWV